MNIYIRLYISAREYFAKMLLGTLAASRGHHVLLGAIPRLDGRFPPGLYHTNDLSKRKAPYLGRLSAAGFRITAHDEEQGIIEGTADESIRSRFHSSTLAHVSSSFTWGEWDRSALEAAFPQYSTRFVLSGSPRVDLWRRDSNLDRFTSARAEQFRSDKKTILVVSNFGPQPTPNWMSMGVTRGHELGLELTDRVRALLSSLESQRALAEFLTAIDAIATRWPAVRVVVRPHPTEVWGGLAQLVEPRPNVIVTREGTTSEWLRVCDVMVHSFTTTGFEAMIAGVPTIAYTPGGTNAGFLTSRIGRQASDLDSLISTVDFALSGSADARRNWFPPHQSSVLRERVHLPQGLLASQIIVEDWERIACDAGFIGIKEPSTLRLLRLRRPTASAVVIPRRYSGDRPQQVDSRGSEIAALSRDESVRFPPFVPDDLQSCADGIASALGLPPVRAERLRPRLVRLRASSKE